MHYSVLLVVTIQFSIHFKGPKSFCDKLLYYFVIRYFVYFNIFWI